VVRELKTKLPAFSAAPAGATSSETAANLRSLGYLSGRSATKEKERYGPEDDPKSLVAIDTKIHDMIDLYQRGRGGDALELARALVRERPEMATGYEYLSFLLDRGGDTGGAVRTLREAERRGLLDERLRSRLGLLLADTGHAAEALAALEPLTKSENPDAWNAIGVARSGAGQTAAAIAAFEKALALDPKNAVACQNIGIALVKAEKFPEAVAAFDRAFAINERLPRAWNGKGVALERLGRHEEAVAAWKRAVDLDPGQLDALFNVGMVSAQRGDAATARIALRAFIERAPARSRADVAHAQQVLASLPPDGASRSRNP
jgi:Flp pilus assembly protein TadD